MSSFHNERPPHDFAERQRHGRGVSFVAAIALVFVASTSPLQAVSVSSVTLYQMDFFGQNVPTQFDTDWGDLEFTLAPDGDLTDYYAQLVIRNPSSATTHWVVRNMAIPGSSDLSGPMTVARFFDLGVLGIPGAVTQVEYHLALTSGPIGSPPSTPGWTLTTPADGKYDTQGSGEDSIGDHSDPGPAPAAPAVAAAQPQRRKKVCRDDVPDIEEGKNECGPVGVTRSLRWLHDNGDIDLGNKTNAQLIQDFKNASGWTAAGGVPKYSGYLDAKLKLNKDCKLGLDVKFMVRRPSSVPAGDYTTANGTAVDKGNDPTFAFIKKEIDDGEDVEILVGWLDANGNRTNGHCMTVIGYEEDPNNGVQQIWVQDDEDQGKANAKNKRRNTDYTDGMPPKLDDLAKNRVEMVLSESPKPPECNEGSGGNYIHLLNGVDYFFGKTPPNGAFTGIWRCFPGKMLHSPTLDTKPGSPTFGTYATRISSIHATMTGSAGDLIRFPTIALSSSPGDCTFFTPSGNVNYGIASVASLGQVVVGPLADSSGPVPVTFLGGIANVVVANPTGSPGTIVQMGLDLSATNATVGVPDGESLVLWIQDDPTQTGAGTMQYWTGSIDERNLCSGYSFLLSSSGGAFFFAPSFEWSIGLGTHDATLTTAITSTGPGPSSLNAHDAVQGFSPGFDAGSGARTISITGAGIGSEFLGFAIYDEQSVAGRFHLVVANAMGLQLPVAPTCSRSGSGFLSLPTGGPGGPVFSTLVPEQPRSVGKFDALSNLLLGNPLWLASTNFSSSPGSLNVPWFPSPAGNSGSNASGANGGFVIPLPPLPSMVGKQLFLWGLSVDPSNAFLDLTANDGHSLTNGFDVLFFP